MRGIINIVIGVALIGAAASGQFVLRGTDSSLPLGVIGVAIAALGVYRVVMSRKRK